MINNYSNNNLDPLVKKVIQEGIKSMAHTIDMNKRGIKDTLEGLHQDTLSLGEVEELVLANQKLQEHINKAEELIDKPGVKNLRGWGS